MHGTFICDFPGFPVLVGSLFFYEGKGYPNSILSGLSWERADDGPTLNAGLVAFRFSADPD